MEQSGDDLEQPPASGEADAVPDTTSTRPSAITELLRLGPDAPDEVIKNLIYDVVRSDLEAEPIANDYTVIILHDEAPIERVDTDRIYRALSSTTRSKPVLLILDSPGGSIAPAFFIAKLCREYSHGGFEVAVARRAKSAATLICCGADKIHMGSLSELGPIDPQFDDIPGLALKYSIEHLAELTKRYPASANMFAEYLSKALRIEALGYYERVAESAAHYADKLLKSRLMHQEDTARREIANRLVYEYKDHGFVIDSQEATEIFGASVVEQNSAQYALANRIYRTFDLIRFLLRDFMERNFAFTGSTDGGCYIVKRTK